MSPLYFNVRLRIAGAGKMTMQVATLGYSQEKANSSGRELDRIKMADCGLSWTRSVSRIANDNQRKAEPTARYIDDLRVTMARVSVPQSNLNGQRRPAGLLNRANLISVVK